MLPGHVLPGAAPRACAGNVGLFLVLCASVTGFVQGAWLPGGGLMAVI